MTGDSKEKLLEDIIEGGPDNTPGLRDVLKGCRLPDDDAAVRQWVERYDDLQQGWN